MMPSEENQKPWEYASRFSSVPSPDPCGMFLAFRKTTCLLLTTQVTFVMLVSSLPVRLSVTSLPWKLFGPEWENSLLLQGSKSTRDFWNVPVPRNSAGAECGWRNACSRRHDCVSLFALGDSPGQVWQWKQRNGLAPWRAVLKHLMMIGQELKKETNISPPLLQLRTEPITGSDDCKSNLKIRDRDQMQNVSSCIEKHSFLVAMAITLRSQVWSQLHRNQISFRVV